MSFPMQENDFICKRSDPLKSCCGICYIACQCSKEAQDTTLERASLGFVTDKDGENVGTGGLRLFEDI